MNPEGPVTDGSLVFKATGDGKVRQSDATGYEIVFDPDEWRDFRKHALTRAVRVPGPFTVETSEGPLRCEDGYLAVDARGYPYPIATEEFELIYRPAPAPGSTDDNLRPGQTVKEAIDRCIEIARERQASVTSNQDGAAKREYALAITALEDAQMRYARGRHMQEGSFEPSDVDRWLQEGRDPVEVRDERDRAAGKPRPVPRPQPDGGHNYG